MRTLFIDTTSDTLTIALKIDDTKSICEKTNDVKEHSVYAVEKIKDLIDKNNLNPNDIDKIIVVNGPGSFTGIRIGVTIAKTFAYTLNKKISVASSLKNMIIGKNGYDYYISKIEDKRDKNYVGIYDKEYKTIFEGLIDDNELNIKLNEISNYEIVVDNKYNVDNVIDYYIKQEDINPHLVNPNYLKDVI